MTRRVGGRRRMERRSPSEPLAKTELETFEPAATPQSAVLRLQTDTGNAAVARLLARQPGTATSPGPITSPSQLDKPTEAEAAEPPVTRTGVEGAQDWFDRAVAHYDAGRYEKALHAFEEAYKLYPQANFLYNEAACLERLGRKEEAADMYGRYLAGSPAATDAEKVKKRIAKLRGEVPQKPAKVDDPASPGPITSPSQVDKPAEAEAEEPPITRTGVEGAQDWFDRAYAHYEAGRYEKALHGYAEAYRLYPQPPFLYNEAACLERLGRKEEAADMYGRYLAGSPTATDAEKVKKRIEKLRGQTPKPAEPEHPAESEHKAPTEEPITATGTEGARAWFDRGQQAYLAGDFLKAAEDFKQAFLLKPMAAFVFNEGAALEQAKRPEAAANAFEHYLVLEPGAGDREKTIERIKKLRGEASGKDALLDPWADETAAPPVTATGKEGAKQWFDRGTVAYEVGDYKRAYDDFVQAYDLLPRAEFVFNQAASLDLGGNADAAVQAYERYLALVPKATDAEKVRKRIKLLRSGAAGGGLKNP